MKVLKEWSIQAPWGNIALISWGDRNGEPVLLVHGRKDSAVTFLPLLELLPEKYHYVGVDLPGNGRSQSFPPGLKLTRFQYISAVEVVIKHLQWKQFVYIGHSLGCEQGLFYNVVYPGRIKKMVHLDLGLSLQRLQVHDPVEYYQLYFDYYANLARYSSEAKLYTRKKAMDAVMKARGLTEPQAAIILSRNLIQVGDDVFKLSWDNRLRYPAPQNLTVDYYYELFSKNAPPTLLITATDKTLNPFDKGREEAAEIIKRLRDNLKHFKEIVVQGGHDVHFTNPERLASEVAEFLENVSLCPENVSSYPENVSSYPENVSSYPENVSSCPEIVDFEIIEDVESNKLKWVFGSKL